MPNTQLEEIEAVEIEQCKECCAILKMNGVPTNLKHCLDKTNVEKELGIGSKDDASFIFHTAKYMHSGDAITFIHKRLQDAYRAGAEMMARQLVEEMDFKNCYIQEIVAGYNQARSEKLKRFEEALKGIGEV